MDIGDWVFLGLIVISGIASVSKAGKKKAAEQSSGPQTSTRQNKSDADEWIKTIIRESTKGLLNDDEFIPKNEAKPTEVQPAKPASRPSDTKTQPYANAEQYRRNNKSLEGFVRPRVSLENTTVVEGNVSRTSLRTPMQSLQTEPVYEHPLLNPVDDFSDSDEVRKAVIYGEILRTKF